MRQSLPPLADRGPLRVMFLITSMPVGGAETLLVNLIRRLDRTRFLPELCCLKDRGPLGDILAQEIPTFANLLAGKYDLRILARLARLLRERRIDAVITVGAGDKMFWGRLAARRARVPVVVSALHSTGWPDGIGRLNRLLTPWTDAFVGVAEPHGRYLVEQEGLPAQKVRVISNGIDVGRFQPRGDRQALRASLGFGPETPLAGIVAALRPEKNHELLLTVAQQVSPRVPGAKFLVVGDGPRRVALAALAQELGVSACVRFLGTRHDIPELLAALDVFVLTSHVEANPVSILEALACGTPVVATNVGSVGQSVIDGLTGHLVAPGDAVAMTEHLVRLLSDPNRAGALGAAGRQHVLAHGSLERMVAGYEQLIEEIYASKVDRRWRRPRVRVGECPEQTIEQVASRSGGRS